MSHKQLYNCMASIKPNFATHIASVISYNIDYKELSYFTHITIATRISQLPYHITNYNMPDDRLTQVTVMTLCTITVSLTYYLIILM